MKSFLQYIIETSNPPVYTFGNVNPTTGKREDHPAMWDQNGNVVKQYSLDAMTNNSVAPSQSNPSGSNPSGSEKITNKNYREVQDPNDPKFNDILVDDTPAEYADRVRDWAENLDADEPLDFPDVTTPRDGVSAAVRDKLSKMTPGTPESKAETERLAALRRQYRDARLGW